ncbi:GntR family transcriptional regulator [Anaerostipes faecalis]|uniref:GntR family transcriptional regulator n=1 Tax=Anaerostipes faecalis TaxID=2738446 RepID=UPI003EFC969E
MKKLDMSRGAVPLYLQISAILKEKIIKKEYEYGDYIPSEAELQKIYDVSRITARQAIQELEKDGMVQRARGKGTMVTYQKQIEEYLTSIRSFTNEMLEKNMQPGTKSAHISIEKADQHLAEIFQVEEGVPVYRLERIRTGDGIPIVDFHTYLSLKLNLPLNDDFYMGSLYEILEGKGCEPVRVTEKFDCMIPNEDICRKLNIEIGQPVLRRIRIAHDINSEVVEYTIGYYRGDRYAYYIELKK